MTKEEFLKRIEEEKLYVGEYMIVTEDITDAPSVMGCAYNGGKWKIYETWERGGHFIIKTFETENEAFNFFYEIVLNHHKMNIGDIYL